jgi:integrase
MYPYTGLRLSELRLAARKDLNEQKMELWVRNPKGKNCYGKQRTVPIPPPIRLYVKDFLQLREEHLRLHGINECNELIPRVKPDNTTVYYSSNHFRKLKKHIQDISGIDFKIKYFRASFAQIHKDKGVPIETISKALGHSSMETTELFYARIRDVSMIKQINNVWLKKPDAKKCEISILAR